MIHVKQVSAHPALQFIANVFEIQDEGAKWGCNIFLEKMGVTVIGAKGDEPELPEIEPDLKKLPNCMWPE